jgi:hypothetical protein
MEQPTMMMNPMEQPMMMNPMEQPMMMNQVKPEVINVQAPSFKLVLPFAAFDRSTPTKFAGSILNWASLLACMIWIYLMGKYGFKSGKTIGVFSVCVIFTLATTVLLSTSGYTSIRPRTPQTLRR